MTIAHGFAHRDDVGPSVVPPKPPHGIARAAKSRLHAGALHPFDAGAHAWCKLDGVARAIPAFSAQPHGPPRRLSSSKRS